MLAPRGISVRWSRTCESNADRAYAPSPDTSPELSRPDAFRKLFLQDGSMMGTRSRTRTSNCLRKHRVFPFHHAGHEKIQNGFAHNQDADNGIGPQPVRTPFSFCGLHQCVFDSGGSDEIGKTVWRWFSAHHEQI